jgi:hypothetical protein
MVTKTNSILSIVQKIKPIIFIILFFILGYTLAGIIYFLSQNKIEKLEEQPEAQISNYEKYEIDSLKTFQRNQRWSLIAESPRYSIFLRGSALFTTILDKNLNKILAPDESCEVTISETDRNNGDFYNKTVGIIRHGAYKTIRFDASTGEFVQTAANAGCVNEEGRITISTDEKEEKAICDVKIESVLLGC